MHGGKWVNRQKGKGGETPDLQQETIKLQTQGGEVLLFWLAKNK